MTTNHNKQPILNSVNHNSDMAYLNEASSRTVVSLNPIKKLENIYYIGSAKEKTNSYTIEFKDTDFSIPRLANQDGVYVSIFNPLRPPTFPNLSNSATKYFDKDTSAGPSDLEFHKAISFAVRNKNKRKTPLLETKDTPKNTEVIDNLTEQWASSIKDGEPDILGVKLNIRLEQEKQFKEREAVVTLDSGVEEDGQIIYASFIKDGKKYNIKATEPNNNNQQLFYASDTVGLSDKEESLSVTTSRPIVGPKPITKNYKFKFKSGTDTIFLGPNKHILVRSKSYNFIKYCLTTIYKNKSTTVWYYEDLLDDYDSAEKTKTGYLKRCKSNLTYFKSSLGEGLKDLFTIGNTYIRINIKYR